MQKTATNNRLIIIAEGGIMIALALVLSYLRILQMPQGGSVNLTFLPLIVFTYRRGVAGGALAGLAYGVLHFFLDPYHVYHPVSILFDYILSYGLVAIIAIGNTKNSIFLSIKTAIFFICRFIMAVLSGVIVFSSYTPEGQNVWVYSLGYNSYLFVEAAIVIIILISLKKTLLDRIKI